ncbi:HIT domain-containing protein [bacterium]|nr:HIT domain-containing protein [bacterium]
MGILWAPWRMEYLMSEKASECIFCVKHAEDNDAANFVLFRTPHSFVLLNAYPYNNGHVMIAPYRHAASLNELSSEERGDLIEAVARAEALIGSAYSPQGMNIGINLGHCAGAGIAGHVHVHIVPRWEGDTNFMPVVGQTKVMPETLEGTYERLLKHLEE